MDSSLTKQGAPFLSICIPTYNRAGFLKECLDSLEHCWAPDIEIVVSDNASTDSTIEMLADYALRLPLRWIRQRENVGSDRNFAAVVDMAEGRYCWLLGSDDCVTPEALSNALNLLRLHDPDILHFGYVQADIGMRPCSRAAPPASAAPVTMTRAEVPRYLEKMPNVSLLFAFISSFIFRKECWSAQSSRIPVWLDSHYVHTYVLHATLAAGASVMTTNECFVIARGGNPNEFNTTPGKMLALDAVTLNRIYREICPDNAHLAALGRVFRRSYGPNTLVSIASQGGVSRLIDNYGALTALGQSGLLIRSLKYASWLGMMPILRLLIVLRNQLLTVLNRQIRTK